MTLTGEVFDEVKRKAERIIKTKRELSRRSQRNAQEEPDPVEEGDFWALRDVSFEVKA